jgi:hypothetical protein
MTTGTHETEITADDKVPVIRITREFDAPPAKVFRAPRPGDDHRPLRLPHRGRLPLRATAG